VRGFVTGPCVRATNGRCERLHQDAIVGGVAGRFAGHHGLIGAAADCEAKKHERENAAKTFGLRHRFPCYSYRQNATAKEARPLCRDCIAR
jgi:hypothetical protein